MQRTAILLALFLAMPTVLAQPPSPTTMADYAGSVTIDGAPSPAGVTIRVSVPYESQTVSITGTVDANGDYLVDMGDAPEPADNAQIAFAVKQHESEGFLPAKTVAYSASASPQDLTITRTAPEQVTGLVATAEDAESVSIAWAQQSEAPATHVYAFEVFQGSVSVQTVTDGTAATIAGLTTGQEYTFTVRALSHATPSQGPMSAPLTATPATVPSQVDDLTVSVGDSESTWSWTAPAANGRTIDGYRLAFDPAIAGTPTTVATTSIRVDGLTNGQAYSLSVQPYNSKGDGAVSAAVAGTPFTVPSAPTGLAATPYNGEIQVSWTAPDNGGAAISSYEVFIDGTKQATATGTSAFVSGLVNDQTYDVTVTAINVAGSGPASASLSATPIGVPARVTTLDTTAADGQVDLAWDAPAAGDSAITGYKVYQGAVLLATSTSTSHTVTGLTNGNTYQFSVVATNALGDGRQSTPETAIPHATPDAVENLAATVAGGTVTLSWTQPSTGGSDITHYQVARDGTVLGDVTALVYEDAQLASGTYTYTVLAVNAAGPGPVANVVATVEESTSTADTNTDDGGSSDNDDSTSSDENTDTGDAEIHDDGSGAVDTPGLSIMMTLAALGLIVRRRRD